MSENIPKPEEIRLTPEQLNKFWHFILGDDLDFYEEHLIFLTDKEQDEFFEENPDFMSEYPISRERMYLMRDKIFRGILHKIKTYKEEKEQELRN